VILLLFAVILWQAAQNITLLVSLAITLTGKESINTLHTLSPPLQGLAQEQAGKEN
jgi:hypothetical protein